MRSLVVRQRMARVAAVAASVVLVASACGTKPGGDSNDPADKGDGSLGALSLTEGTLLVSDGTNVVTIGDQKVTFPTKVTDAAWSPDGSRIAFVDGDGNIATARPDGTGVLVLTGPANGAVRSRPSWARSVLFYAEKKPDGTSALKAVPINGCSAEGQRDTGEDWPMDTGEGTSYVDLAPSGSQSQKPARLAFQHNEPSGPEIWINDTNQRAPGTGKLVDGSEPALRVDGTKVAYVDVTGQISVRDTLATATSVQITFGADHPTRLTWMPDGQHVAYQTPSGIESVSTSPGSGSNPATRLSTTTGVPTFLSFTKDTVSRISGADPIALSIAASQARWPTVSHFFMTQSNEPAPGLVLTTPDQVSRLGQPSYYAMLLTTGDTLDPRTKAEIQRMFGVIDPNYGGVPTVTLYGDAVSPGVASVLTSMNFKVDRHALPTAGVGAGADGTCVVSGSLFGQRLVVVDSSSASDSAVASWSAASFGAPVLRVDGKAPLPDQVKAYLQRSSAAISTVLIVDSSGGIPAGLEEEVAKLVTGPAGYTTESNPTAGRWPAN